MTPEEKAKSLFFKFTYQREDEHENYIAKQCAIDCVDEILYAIKGMICAESGYSANEYYQEVKIQIQEL